MWHDSPINTVKSGKRSRKNSAFDPEKVLPDVESAVHLRPARNPPKTTIYDAFPPFIIFLPIHIMVKKVFRRSTNRDDLTRDMFGKRKEAAPIDSNIPLEISLFLSSYFSMLNTQGLLVPAIATAYVSSVSIAKTGPTRN